jgi:hypothetical protein
MKDFWIMLAKFPAVSYVMREGIMLEGGKWQT